MPVSEELRTLGKNVPLYLDSKGYDDAQRQAILTVANAMAERRNTIIHLDYVMVADGTIRENQMGNRLVWQTRRALRRKRGVGLPVGRVAEPVNNEPAVKPRRRRRRVTEDA
jgi:hypothetical protein